MKVVLCGSMSFVAQMKKIKKELEYKNFQVFAPQNLETYDANTSEKARIKKSLDVYNTYYEEIKNTDCILVVNEEKNEIAGYIGANALIEMAFAYVLKKKIYLLYPVSKESPFFEEIFAMSPEVLHGDLEKII